MVAAIIEQFWSTTETNRFHKVVTLDFGDSVEVFIDKDKEVASDGYHWPVDPRCDRCERGEGDREANRVRAARRARTQVRRRCKAIGADVMMTLTYRENMTDEKRMHRDFEALRKRLKAVGLSLQYVAVMERQARGALHLHVATRRLAMYMKDANGGMVKSYRLFQSIWRSVVGRDNGNVDFTKRKHSNAAHKIAQYIAKYIGKAIEERVFNKKGYWCSAGIVLPVAKVEWWPVNLCTPEELVRDVALMFHNRDLTDLRQYHAPISRSFSWFEASINTKEEI